MREIENDVLHIDYEPKCIYEALICITRIKDGDTTILKMELGEQAKLIHKLLTDQSVKIKELEVR